MVRPFQIALVALILVFGGFFVFAGNTANNSTPVPTMHSVNDIYDLIDDTATSSKNLAPTGTSQDSMHSISDLYIKLANLIDANDLASSSVTYLGISGIGDIPMPTIEVSPPREMDGSEDNPGDTLGFTLDDIYSLITDNNRILSPDHSFLPTAAPENGGTMHSLEDIYQALSTLIVPENIKVGARYLGVDGTYETVESGFCGGTGTEENPYQICDLAMLQLITENLTASYILMNDLDASETENWNGGAGFEPIGTAVTGPYFTGVFDGNHHTISNFYINRPDTIGAALFGAIGDTDDYATIKDLILENVNIQGGMWSAGLVGDLDFADINNCHVDGGLIGTLSPISTVMGGLVGKMNGGEITRSSNSANISMMNGVIGGLAGEQNGGSISYSYSSGNFSSDGTIGGLVGSQSNGSITTSHSSADIQSSDGYVGGLVGFSSGEIADSYFTGTVYGGPSGLGGLVGGTDGSISTSYSMGVVDDTHVPGNAGGIAGYVDAGASEYSSFWDIQTSGQAEGIIGTGTTTVAMKTQATFAGWDFDTIWGINEGADYPYLR